MHAMPWNDFELFLALARGGSHAAGARVLGVDRTTIGRRLTGLQQAFGAQLFERTAARLQLTEAGRALVPHAERMELEALAAERELRGADARLSGHVRLTATDGLLSYAVLPRLSELCRAHPGLDIEIRADAKELDVSRREADVAVRLYRPKQSSLISRRAGAMRFGLYASRRYLATHEAPRRVEDLASHGFIDFAVGVDLPQHRWLVKHVPSPRYAVHLNTTAGMVAACKAGLGIAVLPTFIAPHEPDLVPLLSRLAALTRELHLVTHEGLRRNARILALMDWLTPILQALDTPH